MSLIFEFRKQEEPTRTFIWRNLAGRIWISFHIILVENFVSNPGSLSHNIIVQKNEISKAGTFFFHSSTFLKPCGRQMIKYRPLFIFASGFKSTDLISKTAIIH